MRRAIGAPAAGEDVRRAKDDGPQDPGREPARTALRRDPGGDVQKVCPMDRRILIVDDDPVVQENVRAALEAEGYAVDSAYDGAHGLLLSALRAPALIVLELGLADMSGEQVLREVRRRSAVRVLVLSALDRVDDRVRGLDLGADDYMVKPFGTVEVVARVEALLRRVPEEPARPYLHVFDGGRLEIDTHRREVRVDRAVRPVTRSEFELLLALAEQPGCVQSRATIVGRLRSDRRSGDVHVVDVHVRNLRRKIEDDPARPRWIETIRGRGYRIGLAAE
jgi:DNA-binding response OmpR family regulator